MTPLEWHKECLANQEKSLERAKTEMLSAIDRYAGLLASVAESRNTKAGKVVLPI